MEVTPARGVTSAEGAPESRADINRCTAEHPTGTSGTVYSTRPDIFLQGDTTLLANIPIHSETDSEQAQSLCRPATASTPMNLHDQSQSRKAFLPRGAVEHIADQIANCKVYSNVPVGSMDCTQRIGSVLDSLLPSLQASATDLRSRVASVQHRLAYHGLATSECVRGVLVLQNTHHRHPVYDLSTFQWLGRSGGMASARGPVLFKVEDVDTASIRQPRSFRPTIHLRPDLSLFTPSPCSISLQVIDVLILSDRHKTPRPADLPPAGLYCTGAIVRHFTSSLGTTLEHDDSIPDCSHTRSNAIWKTRHMEDSCGDVWTLFDRCRPTTVKPPPQMILQHNPGPLTLASSRIRFALL